MRRTSRPIHQTQSRVDGPSPFSLPASVLLATELVIKKSWAGDTLTGYSAGVKAFSVFCDAYDVPLADRLPASETLICAFVASRAGKYKETSTQNCVSGVRAWHITNNAPWVMGLRLRQTLRGVHALAPKGLPPRPPVTSDMLVILAQELDLSSPLDVCVLAAATSSLWGQARLGELFSPWANSFDGGYIPLRSSLGGPTTEDGSRPLHLPWTKTRKAAGDVIMICRQNGASDPVDALERHLLVNNPPANIPLFSYKSEAGFTCLTRKRLLLVCNRIWEKHGFVRIQGHCLRIGGTTELLMRGVNPEIVKSMGRWSSDAFLLASAFWVWVCLRKARQRLRLAVGLPFAYPRHTFRSWHQLRILMRSQASPQNLSKCVQQQTRMHAHPELAELRRDLSL
ncbi:hypothetical protein PLICRDRAFT_114194 [Plicaturopsis crispa FD-325 SS-3]|nr:hypothetical protein PLICRDRAFT_114194 [Plicaturopsis crispa FD-325 SS-3]